MQASEDKIKREALRLLGYGEASPDRDTDRIVDEMIITAKSVSVPKAIHGIFDIEAKNGEIYFPYIDLLVKGKSIYSHLEKAEKCIIFASTLGLQTELTLETLQKKDMVKAVVFDAVCSALIEEFSDEYCLALRKELFEKGKFINTRFSPGYGDLELTYQKDICAALDTEKTIRLSVTDSYTLFPRKSISAFIGIFSEKPQGASRGCVSCTLREKCKLRGNKECSALTDFT